jgi:protein-arginine kinase activator protein McsA
MERTAVYCARCHGFRRYAAEGEDLSRYEGDDVLRWIPACDWCLQREAGRARVTGVQPAVCLQCREPFEATRQGQRFCSASCRARAWRQSRRATLTTELDGAHR